MFVVFSLPRSRSAWLSVFLSRGNRLVGHDIGIECASPADFVYRLQNGLAGTCETGTAFAWRLIRSEFPEAKFAVVRRSPLEVSQSLDRFGLTGFLPEMERRFAFLDEISALPGSLMVNFETLTSAIACAKLFEHCLGESFDLDWWKMLDPMNVQIDMQRRIQRLRANFAQIEALKAQVAKRIASE